MSVLAVIGWFYLLVLTFYLLGCGLSMIWAELVFTKSDRRLILPFFVTLAGVGTSFAVVWGTPFTIVMK